MNFIEIKAPAKINIGLNVVSMREDGYHNLATLFYPVPDLADKIILKKSGIFSFTCNDKKLELDPTNLIIKALKILENYLDQKISVDIRCEKNIPVGGGLGGGSSDAAAVLLGLNNLYSLGLSSDQLRKFALELGSDVPFFLRPEPSAASSRGEILRKIDFTVIGSIVLINPGIHISTREAFKHVIPKKTPFNYEFLDKKNSNELKKLKNSIENDFESYVFSKHNQIARIKELLYEEGAIFALMSGTGSTVFGIFDNAGYAEQAVKKLPDKYFKFIGLPYFSS